MPARDNISNRKGAGIPPLGAGDAFGLNAQYQSLVGQRSDILGMLAAQRAEIKGGFKNERAAVRRAEAQGVADVENASIGRGVLGSSVDYKGRITVRSNAATQLAQALTARNQALLANRAAEMQANRDFEMGTANLQAQRAALRSQQVATDFLAGLGSGVGGLALGGNGQGGAADVGPQQKKRLRKLGNTIEDAALAYVRASGSARDDFYNRLLDVWQRRNDIRRKFGLAPIGRARLNAYVQDLAQQYDTPGGLT